MPPQERLDARTALLIVLAAMAVLFLVKAAFAP
jgi:hypothetical protein